MKIVDLPQREISDAEGTLRQALASDPVEVAAVVRCGDGVLRVFHSSGCMGEAHLMLALGQQCLVMSAFDGGSKPEEA
ncbi:MAG: hypothetical protein U1E34_10165 [Amaricoccus sp.]